MSINEILNNIGITKCRLAKLAGIPNATPSELCSSKTNIEKCSAETLYKIAKVLNVSMESLLDDRMTAIERERFLRIRSPIVSATRFRRIQRCTVKERHVDRLLLGRTLQQHKYSRNKRWTDNSGAGGLSMTKVFAEVNYVKTN